MTARNTHQSELPKIGQFEFWVRFVCGALLGTLIGARLFFILFDQLALLLVITVAALARQSMETDSGTRSLIVEPRTERFRRSQVRAFPLIAPSITLC